MIPLHNPNPTAVSARGAAAILGMSTGKVTSLIHRNLIPAEAIGRTYRITLADLERVRTERPDLFPAAT